MVKSWLACVMVYTVKLSSYLLQLHTTKIVIYGGGTSGGDIQGASAPPSPQYILKPFLTAAFAVLNKCTEILAIQ